MTLSLLVLLQHLILDDLLFGAVEHLRHRTALLEPGILVSLAEEVC